MVNKLPRILKPFGSADWERKTFGEVAEIVYAPATTEEALIDALANDIEIMLADVVIRVTRRVLTSAPTLHSIVCYSTGIDYVDLADATEQGIVVCNTPDYSSLAVAEHTIALMFAISRHVVRSDASTRTGRWHNNWSFGGVELEGKTLGVIGFGHIGRVVARKATGLGMHVLACAAHRHVEAARALGVALAELEDILHTADYVTIHTPLKPETRGLIGPRQIAMMKPGAYLINCARGGIVDEVALHEALVEGRLAGAALDVFGREPVAPADPLLQLENVVVTPHIAWHTREAMKRAQAMHEADLRCVLDGRPPMYIMNPEVLPRWRRLS